MPEAIFRRGAARGDRIGCHKEAQKSQKWIRLSAPSAPFCGHGFCAYLNGSRVSDGGSVQQRIEAHRDHAQERYARRGHRYAVRRSRYDPVSLEITERGSHKVRREGKNDALLPPTDVIITTGTQ